MKTLFVMTPLQTPDSVSAANARVLGISERMDTLPAVFEPVEVYAVRCSEAVIEEVRELLSKEHTAGRALGLLRSRAHSFTYVGNA